MVNLERNSFASTELDVTLLYSDIIILICVLTGEAVGTSFYTLR